MRKAGGREKGAAGEGSASAWWRGPPARLEQRRIGTSAGAGDAFQPGAVGGKGGEDAGADRRQPRRPRAACWNQGDLADLDGRLVTRTMGEPTVEADQPPGAVAEHEGQGAPRISDIDERRPAAAAAAAGDEQGLAGAGQPLDEGLACSRCPERCRVEGSKGEEKGLAQERLRS
jgi:hypothetical protein